MLSKEAHQSDMPNIRDTSAKRKNAVRYAARGVYAEKHEVHVAVGKANAAVSSRPLFPGAFCTIAPDVLTQDAAHCLVMHADGAGSKSAVAYLMYKELGDARVFAGLAQDALVMNIDDMLCVGATGPFLVSNTIGRNAKRIPGDALEAMIDGFGKAAAQLGELGVEVHLNGGETADIGDLTPTVVVDATAVARMARQHVKDNRGIQAGDIIVGLASAGQARYETLPNSGMGSNGLTSARHDLLSKHYFNTYPETCDSSIPKNLRYCGPFRVQDSLPGSPLTIGKALLSPTRSYAPLILPLLAEPSLRVSALIHCTGGGQTKCLRSGQGIHFVKNTPFELPPLFKVLHETSGAAWRELYQVFNMGWRFEVVGEAAILPFLETLGQKWGVRVQQVGVCQKSTQTEHNQLSIHTPTGIENYQLAV